MEAIFAVRSVDIIESVLSRHIGDWEAVLTRNGYDLKALAALLAVKPREIKLLLQGQLYIRSNRPDCCKN